MQLCGVLRYRFYCSPLAIRGGRTLLSSIRNLAAPVTDRKISQQPIMAVHTERETAASSNKRFKAYDALLLDAGGTLLQLVEPVEETYASIGRRYGLNSTPPEIRQGFRRAFSAPWSDKLRYQGDGRPFWRHVVSEATGCSHDDYFEEVYQYFANGNAWKLPHGAYETIVHLKDAGVKLAVVSNFDTRLRKLLEDLNVSSMFDAIIVSSEVGYEKPDSEIFRAALDEIRVEAGKAVHVGDDEKADKLGANAVGIDCWLWGIDIRMFSEIEERILQSEV